MGFVSGVHLTALIRRHTPDRTASSGLCSNLGILIANVTRSLVFLNCVDGLLITVGPLTSKSSDAKRTRELIFVMFVNYDSQLYKRIIKSVYFKIY